MFFNDTATTEIYTLSLHDALPIWGTEHLRLPGRRVADVLQQPALREIRDEALQEIPQGAVDHPGGNLLRADLQRSEEHTSELQSQSNLVCRLLLEKKKKDPPIYAC